MVLPSVPPRLARQRAVVLLLCGVTVVSTVARGQNNGLAHCLPDSATPSASLSTALTPASASSAVRAGSVLHGRLTDPRISYVTLGPYICRWRLDRQDTTAATSDVVHPIRYVIDTSVPEKWRPAVLRGVTAWLPAFEAIGFRHALTVQVTALTDLTAADVNVVRVTMDRDSTNASIGTQCTAQPTTGEISAGCTVEIGFGIVQSAAPTWYMVMSGGDPTVPLPLPDSMLSFYLQSGIAHEIGHTLGLGHNWHAALAYPTDSLRSAAFVRRWGYTASVMMYSVYNEAAQPDDRIPYRDRVFQLGPYDSWALAWAYRPIPGAPTPEAEQPTLEQWRRAQDTASYLRVSVPGSATPEERVTSNAWGGDDVLKAMTLWFQNADRLSRRLLSSSQASSSTSSSTSRSRTGAVTTLSPDDREALLLKTIAAWHAKLLTISTLVGGQEPQPPYARDATATRMLPVPVPRQVAALRLILASALYGEDPMIDALTGTKLPARSARNPAAVARRPLLFSAFSGSSYARQAALQSAQHSVLSTLAQGVSAMPREARPAMCQEFSVALDALMRLEARPQTTAEEQTQIKVLEKMFLVPLARLCPGK